MKVMCFLVLLILFNSCALKDPWHLETDYLYPMEECECEKDGNALSADRE